MIHMEMSVSNLHEVSDSVLQNKDDEFKNSDDIVHGVVPTSAGEAGYKHCSEEIEEEREKIPRVDFDAAIYRCMECCRRICSEEDCFRCAKCEDNFHSRCFPLHSCCCMDVMLSAVDEREAPPPPPPAPEPVESEEEICHVHRRAPSANKKMRTKIGVHKKDE